MDYATWEKYKKALANETWTAWGKWPADVQDAMRDIPTDNTQLLTYEGLWIDRAASSSYHAGTTYRVNPAWPGPAKPTPVAWYEDVPVDCKLDRHHYMFARDGEVICSIVFAPADPRFVGYVMPDGKLRSRLIFDLQKDGTYRLRVPLAVRLRKEVAR